MYGATTKRQATEVATKIKESYLAYRGKGAILDNIQIDGIPTTRAMTQQIEAYEAEIDAIREWFADRYTDGTFDAYTLDECYEQINLESLGTLNEFDHLGRRLWDHADSLYRLDDCVGP